MFARTYFALAALALGPILAVANNPTETVTVTAPGPTITTLSQCNTGDLLCCQSTQTVSQNDTGLLGLVLGILGIVISGTGQIASTCSPLTVIGAGGTSCTAQPVCCSDNSFNGIIAAGCSPIDINL